MNHLFKINISTDDAYRLPSPLSATKPITIHTNQGRLGNQMFTFATLYGLSSLNGRNMVVMQSNYDVLVKYFNIHYPLVSMTINWVLFE